MKKETKGYMKILRYLYLMVVIAFGLIAIVGTGGGGGDDGAGSAAPGSDTTPQTITPGTWTGPADFGESSFIVDSTSTGITEITFAFNNFTCGSVTRNGSIKISAGTPWPIDDRQFTIKRTLAPNFEMTLIGTYDNTGTNVSGTYDAVYSGTTCSGTWNATPSTSTTGCTDADSDGYYAESGCGTAVDCNDGDAAIHPGATEICSDGKDNDCDGDVDTDDADCSSPSAVTPGEWSGPAGFGELSFTVNSTSTRITKLVYNYRNFRCGGVISDGAITYTSGSGWPITNRQFSITTGTSDRQRTVNGTFDATGKNASGTYDAVYSGTTCSGTWNATPN